MKTLKELYHVLTFLLNQVDVCTFLPPSPFPDKNSSSPHEFTVTPSTQSQLKILEVQTQIIIESLNLIQVNLSKFCTC